MCGKYYTLGLPRIATNLFNWSMKSFPSKIMVFPNSYAKIHPIDQISTDFVYTVEPIKI